MDTRTASLRQMEFIDLGNEFGKILGNTKTACLCSLDFKVLFDEFWAILMAAKTRMFHSTGQCRTQVTLQYVPMLYRQLSSEMPTLWRTNEGDFLVKEPVMDVH